MSCCCYQYWLLRAFLHVYNCNCTHHAMTPTVWCWLFQISGRNYLASQIKCTWSTHRRRNSFQVVGAYRSEPLRSMRTQNFLIATTHPRPRSFAANCTCKRSYKKRIVKATWKNSLLRLTRMTTCWRADLKLFSRLHRKLFVCMHAYRVHARAVATATS